jgi:hypothetical protein
MLGAALSVLHKQLWNGASCHETFSGDLLAVGMGSVEGHPSFGQGIESKHRLLSQVDVCGKLEIYFCGASELAMTSKESSA